jgi:hypothetical protein
MWGGTHRTPKHLFALLGTCHFRLVNKFSSGIPWFFRRDFASYAAEKEGVQAAKFGRREEEDSLTIRGATFMFSSRALGGQGDNDSSCSISEEKRTYSSLLRLMGKYRGAPRHTCGRTLQEILLTSA